MQKNKKLYFNTLLKNSLVGGLSLFAFFFLFTSSVNASQIQNWNLSGSENTITLDESGALICYMSKGSGGNSSTIIPMLDINNESGLMENIYNDATYHSNWNPAWGQSVGISVKWGVTAGSHTIYMPYNYTVLRCYLDNEATSVKNVMTGLYTDKNSTPNAFKNNQQLDNSINDVVYSFMFFDSGNGGSSPSLPMTPTQSITITGETTPNYGYARSKVYSFKANAENINQELNYTNASSQYWDYALMWSIVFNTAPPITPLTITKNQYNPITGNVFLSGTCQMNGSGINQMNLYAYATGTSTPNSMDKVYPERSSLVDCQDGIWTALFNGLTLTGSNRLVIDDSFFGTQIITTDINWQTSTGGISFDYGDLNTVKIDTSPIGGATTTLQFAYNVCDDPDYNSATSKIYIVGRSGTGFKTLNFDPEVDNIPLESCSGIGEYILHLDQGYTGTVRAYYAYANSYGTEIIHTGNFYINANYATLKKDTEESLFGMTAYHKACTDAEWATEANAFGINTTVMGCTIKMGFYQSVTSLSNLVKGILNGIKDGLLALFPFNVADHIMKAWKNSANQNLPNELNFLNMTDSNGDVTASFPHQWLSTDTDKTFVFFGKSIITGGNQKAIDFFNNFKIFSKYLQWIMYISLLLVYAQRLISHLSVTSDESDNTISNTHENNGVSVGTNNQTSRINTNKHNSSSSSSSRNQHKHKHIKF